MWDVGCGMGDVGDVGCWMWDGRRGMGDVGEGRLGEGRHGDGETWGGRRLESGTRNLEHYSPIISLRLCGSVLLEHMPGTTK